ncbi:MAG: dienelactone hydrolase family protein [bacterium]|nr:dienelactone hydrolase family protein [bacterium]
MSYDPFARGPFPVGVRSTVLTDTRRGDRSLPAEVWYPAIDAHAGRDLDPAAQDAYEFLPGLPPIPQAAVRDATPRAGRRPVVLFSHGFGSHRRQSTFLCTHLASHGYVVAACDHTGNAVLDVLQAMLAKRNGGPTPDTLAELRAFAPLRPADASFLLDRVLDGTAGDVAGHVDAGRVGIAGHSFGGWTSLATAERDRRITATLPLAPAGGPVGLPDEPLLGQLAFDWTRPVPSLFIVADRDSLLPLASTTHLAGLVPAPRRLVALENTDHMHFCDRAEQVHEFFRAMPPPGLFERLAGGVPPIAELAPPAGAELAVRGLGLAHFDATLAGHVAAAQLLAADLGALLADRGVRATEHALP